MILEEITSKEVWEGFLLSQDITPLYQSWDWGEIEKSKGFDVFRLGIKSNGNLFGICQVIHVKARRGPFLHIHHGPLLKVWDWDIFKDVIDQIGKLARTKKAWFLRISTMRSYDKESYKKMVDLSLIPMIGGNKDGIRTVYVDLSKSEDEIFASFRKTTRYNIRKSTRDGVVIERKIDPESNIDDSIKLCQSTAERNHFFLDKDIKDVYKTFAKNNQAVFLNASYKDELIATGLYLYYGKQANSFVRGTSAKYSQMRASYPLQWEAIREAKKRNQSRFNLWGVVGENEKNHPWYGFSHFKRGFARDEEIYLPIFDKKISNKFYLTRLYELFDAKRKGY